MFYANVTDMSHKAAAYLGQLADDVWMAVETHTREADFDNRIGNTAGSWMYTAAHTQCNQKRPNREPTGELALQCGST